MIAASLMYLMSYGRLSMKPFSSQIETGMTMMMKTRINRSTPHTC